MVEVDKRTHKQICSLFKWASKDSFWHKNILSPAKLREKWDQLVLASQQQATDKQQPQGKKFDPVAYVNQNRGDNHHDGQQNDSTSDKQPIDGECSIVVESESGSQTGTD